jgi:hypothetical protein
MGRKNKPEQNLSTAIEGALTDSGLDLETKNLLLRSRRSFFLDIPFYRTLIDSGRHRFAVIARKT